MSRGWKQVASIQHDTDVRLILPFGLNVKNGDVISIASDGAFAIEGSTFSILGMDPGKPRPPTAGGDLCKMSNDGSSYTFRAAGKASSLFPQLPSGSAGFDVHLESAEGWLLAIPKRQLFTIPDVNRFREPILNAYKRRVWQRNWALVFEIATADEMTLLAATSRNTNVALTLTAQLVPNVVDSVKLTAGTFVAQTNRQVIQWIQRESGPVACRALRVQDHMLKRWKQTTVATLGRLSAADHPLSTMDEAFWEVAAGPG